VFSKQLKKSEKYYGIGLRLSSKEPGPVLLFFLDPIGLAGYCLITIFLSYLKRAGFQDK